MKQIIIIGADLGLNGCQILRLCNESEILKDHRIILADHLHELSNLIVSKFENDIAMLRAKEKEVNGFDGYIKNSLRFAIDSFNEKEQKFTRQQHKLAQIHYRRK